MSTDLLYYRSELLIVLALFGLLVLGGELGFRAGRRARTARGEHPRARIGEMQGALLTIFAVLLGFTFAMALWRFDVRKRVVVDEANAIGTAVLRSRFLPESARGDVTDWFRRYVEVRLEARRADLSARVAQNL